MRKDGLISIEYLTREGIALLIYQPGANYVLDDIIEYVRDMSDERATRIVIFEGGLAQHELVRTPGKVWVQICTAPLT